MSNWISYGLAAMLLSVVAGMSMASQPTVVLFVIDGLQPDAAMVAIGNGAVNLKYFRDNGVTVEEAYCTSPAPRLLLPDNSLPWGTTAPPNVAMHTGTHVFESRQMDDVFLAARRAGIKSVFSGGAENYRVFDTADYLYYSNTAPDSVTVQHAIHRLRNDGVRLIRLHLQRLRNHWIGPDEKTVPDSQYQQYLLHVDHLLGTVIREIRIAGLWDSTYVIIAADHGMGMTRESDHPASTPSSWKPYMNFYGPGIRKGESIPYAETPDIALMVAHMLRVGPLRGHTDPKVSVQPKGTTGTLLTNIFETNPPDLPHPRYIRRYLESVNWRPSDEYAEYRTAMLRFVVGEEGHE